MPDAPGGKTTITDQAKPDAGRPSPSERITIALIPRAIDGLLRLVDRTRLSKTDVVNRAIILYEFIDDQTRADQEILIRDKVTGETQAVVLL